MKRNTGNLENLQHEASNRAIIVPDGRRDSFNRDSSDRIDVEIKGFHICTFKSSFTPAHIVEPDGVGLWGLGNLRTAETPLVEKHQAARKPDPESGSLPYMVEKLWTP